jgi:predicted ribosomally synthesized peptide with SipW-like signal peptide
VEVRFLPRAYGEKMKRRQLIGGIGLIGAGAVVGTGGTVAYFSDSEETVTTVTAGEIDIQLDWKAFQNGEQIALQEPTDVDGQIAASFEDVKPGDTGCFSLSLHNETNPAWVWLALDITDETDGGGDDTGDTDCPTATYPLVCGQESTDGGVSVRSEDGTLIVEYFAPSGESFDETHLHIATELAGVPVSGNGGPPPGQFEYDDSDATVVEDEYRRYELDKDTNGIECGTSVVIAAHAARDDGETCWGGSSEFPGANWAKYIQHTVCCTDSSEEQASSNNLADNMIVDLFWDDDADCEIDPDDEVIYENVTLRTLTDNIKRSTGGLMPGWYSTGTQYISLTWRIPSSVGNEIENDTLDLTFSVYAEQRRHNDDPENPWV